MRGLLYRCRSIVGDLSSSLQCRTVDREITLHHELQHESAQLACLSVVRRTVIDHSDILRPLYHAMEIVRIDSHLVVDGSETMRFPYAVGDKRCVIEALGHVAFVAR